LALGTTTAVILGAAVIDGGVGFALVIFGGLIGLPLSIAVAAISIRRCRNRLDRVLGWAALALPTVFLLLVLVGLNRMANS